MALLTRVKGEALITRLGRGRVGRRGEEWPFSSSDKTVGRIEEEWPYRPE